MLLMFVIKNGGVFGGGLNSIYNQLGTSTS